MSANGADLLVESLVAEGVKYLFSLSGNQILSIYDASIDRDVEIIHTRHEATAVHMADGWGRLSDEPGVALVAAGPGHCNALSALYVAAMAESPLVLLSGSCPRAEIGRGAFQEIDQVAMARPVCKAAWMVARASEMGAAVARALAIAGSGRPGPVFLGLPADVLEAPAGAARERPSGGDPEAELSAAQIGEILDLLAAAQRPLILGGPAVGRRPRWQAVESLARQTGIPALPMESPRGVDDPWLHRATAALARADLVLLAGRKLDFALKFGQAPFFAESCRFVQIDADEGQLRPGERVVLSLRGEPRRAMEQLGAAAANRAWPDNPWHREVEALRCAVPAAWGALAGGHPVHPLALCRAVQPYLDEGAVLVSDGGEFGQWVQAGLEAQCRLINGPSGSIGSSLGLALAACLRHPERRVFVFQGDGTFGYHALDFDTALRYGLPVVALVGNDARWNAEHQLQLRHYGGDRTVGCDLLPSRYDELVRALGGHGEFVERAEDLPAAIARALASGLPACVNVAIDGVSAPTFRGEP